MTVRADPKRRVDGKCACGCGKPLLTAPPKTMPKHMRAEFMRELEPDPFRSTECARRFHGCELKKPPGVEPWDDEATAERIRDSQSLLRSNNKIKSMGRAERATAGFIRRGVA